MEKIDEALRFLYGLKQSFGLSDEMIDRLEEDIEWDLCVPVFGEANAGKSSLINALLGRRYLKTGIVPETTNMPAEIRYCHNEYAVWHDVAGIQHEISIKEYMQMKPDPAMASHIGIYLQNGFLEEIPDLTMVDMPAFDVKSAVEDAVLERYLAKSAVLLIVLPADALAGAVTTSFAGFLEKLCRYDVDIHFVITKYDKVDVEGEDFLAAKKYLLDWLGQQIGEREAKYIYASAVDVGMLEGARKFLALKQEDSALLIMKQKLRFAQACLGHIKQKLEKMDSEVFVNDVSAEEIKMETAYRMEVLDEKAAKERALFLKETDACIQKVAEDICKKTEAREEVFVNLAEKCQDPKMQILCTIGQAYKEGVNNEFLPEALRYLGHIQRQMEKQLSANKIRFDETPIDKGRMEEQLQPAVKELEKRIMFPSLQQQGMFFFAPITVGGNYRKELHQNVYPQLREQSFQCVKEFLTSQAEEIIEWVEYQIGQQKEGEQAITAEAMKATSAAASPASRIKAALAEIEEWEEELNG